MKEEMKKQGMQASEKEMKKKNTHAHIHTQVMKDEIN